MSPPDTRRSRPDEGGSSNNPTAKSDASKVSSYGKGDAATRRRWHHERIITLRGQADALPTNVRAMYYAGMQAGCWPDDGSYRKERKAWYEAQGRTSPGTMKLPSQWASNDLQWLIDKGLVSPSEVVDESSTTYSFLGVVDVLDFVLEQTNVVLDPWSPNPVPYILTEGTNDLGIVAPIGTELRCRWAGLGGMAGRSMLRKVAAEIDHDAPIAYIGDWNKTGFDIERNAEALLRSQGWGGEWGRITITDEQAVGLPTKTKFDQRRAVLVPQQSIETAAMDLAEVRSQLRGYLLEFRPDMPDADESLRQEILDVLGGLR